MRASVMRRSIATPLVALALLTGATGSQAARSARNPLDFTGVWRFRSERDAARAFARGRLSAACGGEIVAIARRLTTVAGQVVARLP